MIGSRLLSIKNLKLEPIVVWVPTACNMAVLSKEELYGLSFDKDFAKVLDFQFK